VLEPLLLSVVAGETQKCGFAFITLSFSSVAEVSEMITTNDENLWQFMRYLSKMIG
jgi:hypothetical protein